MQESNPLQASHVPDDGLTEEVRWCVGDSEQEVTSGIRTNTLMDLTMHGLNRVRPTLGPCSDLVRLRLL